MKRAHKALFVLAAVAVLAAGAWVMKGILEGDDGPSEYSMVAMSTGEVYFGKLSWFPNPALREVWILQRTGEETGVVPFTKAFWGPMDKLSLNKKNIVSWARLKKSSELANAFRHPELFENNGTGAVTPENTAPQQ